MDLKKIKETVPQTEACFTEKFQSLHAVVPA